MIGLVEIVGSVYAASMLVLAVAGVAWRLSGRFRHSMVGDHAV